MNSTHTAAQPALALPTRSRSPMPAQSLLGFALALLAVLAIALFTQSTMRRNEDTSSRVAHTLEVMERLQMLLSNLKDAETGQRGYLLTGQAPYLAPYANATAALPGDFTRVRQLVADNPRQAQRLGQLQQLTDTRLDLMRQTIEARRVGDTAAALAIVNSDQGKLVMDRARAVVADMLAEEQSLLQQRQAVWQDTLKLSSEVVSVGSALLMLLIAVAATMAVRGHRARENEAWLRACQSTLSLSLQGEQQLSVVADRVLGFLGQVLNAQVGAFYVAEPNATLRRVAGLALPDDSAGHLLQPGEGLLGEAARSGRMAYVTALPDNHLPPHLPITSSTGRSHPQALLLVPTSTENQVVAAFELGFVGTLDSTELALVERVRELVAVAVRTARERQQLESLLGQTQRQAEELQTQQEELRASNEELEAQGRSLVESQCTLEAQQAELEQANTQLAQHAGRLEEQQRQLLRTQGELQAQAQALAAASQYKSEFLANMSHELRTPLNSSLILSRLLIENKHGTLDAEQVRFAQAIHDANQDLLVLINDILDLSKIEAGHADLQAQTVRLDALAQRLRDAFAPMAGHKQLAFDLAIAPETPPTLVTDAQRLHQVLKNLLANALKFTQHGSVQLHMLPAAGGGVRFDVHDTGLGIAADKLEVIFEAFRQADGSTSRQFGGTGLGLSISRELVHRMGGQIAVSSTPGRGSVFSVTLPAQLPTQLPDDATAAPTPRLGATPAPAFTPLGSLMAPPAPAKSPTKPPTTPPITPPAPPPPARERRVLMAVEDDSHYAAVLKSLVEEMGFDCVVAHTGEQAMALAHAEPLTGILLDVGLPDQSGLAVLEQLKRNAATRHIPVHLVSSYERSVEALTMGAVGHVVKPAQREEIASAVQAMQARFDQPLRHLLLVEDNPVMQESLEHLLAGPQVEITTVGTVAEALAALARTSFDCMVTDLNLPDASGFELLERMATSTTHGFPPVIVYTGRALSRDEEMRLRRHSKSIIVKGARSPERLLDEVTLFLHSIEAHLPAEQQRLLQLARRRDSALEGRCILLAEDDVRNIFALTSVFEPHGVRLEIARNGHEALQKIQHLPQIDLVLMDIMMPEMDGLTAIRQLRQLPAHTHLPVIALTAKAMADDRQQCLAAGANDYLAKPIDVAQLLSLCRVWMPK